MSIVIDESSPWLQRTEAANFTCCWEEWSLHWQTRILYGYISGYRLLYSYIVQVCEEWWIMILMYVFSLVSCGVLYIQVFNGIRNQRLRVEESSSFLNHISLYDSLKCIVSCWYIYNAKKVIYINLVIINIICKTLNVYSIKFLHFLLVYPSRIHSDSFQSRLRRQ